MEFVAEVFAGRLAGERYPEWVDGLYDRLHGPTTGIGRELSRERPSDPADRITRQQAAQRQQFFDTRGTVSEFRQRIREQMATGVLEGLAGQGEIGVESLSRPGETTTRLDTPEGEVTLPREADNIFHDGDQFVRVWDFRPLRVEYTIDRQGVEPEHFLEVVGDRER